MGSLMDLGSSKTHPEVGSWAKVSRKYRPADSRRFHYSFELDGGHSGFILHKKSRRKGRLRMFLDSNDNGRFDKKDQLLVGGVVKKPFFSAKPGSLLKLSDAGLITAKAYAMDDHSGHDHDHDHDHDHSHDHQVSKKTPVGINSIGYQHMSLWTDAMSEVFHDHGASHHDSMMM